MMPNRSAQAWWIFAPLVGVAALRHALAPAFDSLLPGVADEFLEVMGALAFGIAAVWLLAPHLPRGSRFVTFLRVLGTLAAGAGLSLALAQDWSGVAAGTGVELFFVLVLNALAVPLALVLAGRTCRGRYRPMRLCVGLSVMLVGVWLAVMAPFFLIALAATGGGAPWLEFFEMVLTLAGAGFATLLPFLLLSFASPLFRERLKGLLHLEADAPRPVSPEPAGSASA